MFPPNWLEQADFKRNQALKQHKYYVHSILMSSIEATDFEMFPLFEMTPDLVCIAGKDGYFRKINHAVIDKLGYTEKELFGKPISFFYP